VQEFERDFPRPPRPDFSRRWDDEEGRMFPELPDDEGRFHRRPRDELDLPGPGEERFLREQEFGRLRDFDNDPRFPDDRRPPLDWEREDPLHPAYRFLLLLDSVRQFFVPVSSFTSYDTICVSDTVSFVVILPASCFTKRCFRAFVNVTEVVQED